MAFLLEQELQALTSPTFRFLVAVDGAPTGVFTKCTMPTIELEVEPVKEGGLNTYIHQLPGRRKASKIVLENGVGIAADLMAWYLKTMQGDFRRRKVTITLHNSLMVPIMVIVAEGAYPTKWSGPDLRTGEDTVAVQTLELVCDEVVMV
jgi:phage tail-like protein